MSLSSIINNVPEHEQDSDSYLYGLRLQEESIREAKQKNQRYKEDTKHRNFLTLWTGIVVTFWLFCILGLLFFCAWANLYHDKQALSDNVMMALMGTSTLNVLGLSYIVLKGFFNKSENQIIS